MTNERFEPTTCCECGAILTEEEIKEFWNGPYCCTGYNCGCRGLPLDPPYCFKCLKGEGANGER